MNPVCPSCGAALPKVPQRKSKCKACGEFIFIKATPTNPEKRLMTTAEAEKAEAAWAAVRQAQTVDATASRFDIEPRVFAAAVERFGSIEAAARSILLPRAEGGDERAAHGMATFAETSADRLRWQRLGIDLDLARCRSLGLEQVQLRVLPFAKCELCECRSHQILPTSSAASAIIPVDCPRLAEGECAIYLSTTIHAPDGSAVRQRRADRPISQPRGAATAPVAYTAGVRAGNFWQKFWRLLLGTKKR